MPSKVTILTSISNKLKENILFVLFFDIVITW